MTLVEFLEEEEGGRATGVARRRKKDGRIEEGGQTEFSLSLCRTEVSWNTIVRNTYAVVLVRYQVQSWRMSVLGREQTPKVDVGNCATWPIPTKSTFGTRDSLMSLLCRKLSRISRKLIVQRDTSDRHSLS